MEYFKRSMREVEKEDTKLVGAEVPTSIFHYLNLFCIVDGCSKTSVVRPMIEQWAKTAKKEFSEKELIQLTAKHGFKAYKNRKNKKLALAAVLKIQSRELKKKGVPEKTIAKIIKQIENAKSKADKKGKER